MKDNIPKDYQYYSTGELKKYWKIANYTHPWNKEGDGEYWYMWSKLLSRWVPRYHIDRYTPPNLKERVTKVEITEEEHLLFQKLKHILVHSYPDKFPDHYFCCGEGGSKDEMGLPEIILVCAANGVDNGFTKVYRRVGD